MTKITKAVIPVAGFGTRFLPATKAQPKEMLPLVDKPLIQYIVEEAAKSGIEDIILITGQNKRAIEDHFDNNFELEYRLEKAGKSKELEEIRAISNLARFVYVRQKNPQGLGHAILCAKDVVGDEPFAVLLGDDIIASKVPVLKQMKKVYEKYEDAVIGVYKVNKEATEKYGIIDGKYIEENIYQIMDIVEKPKPEEAPSNLAVTGRYILPSRIFAILAKTKPGKGGEIQLTDAIKTLSQDKPLYACKYEGRYYDCGNKLEYVKATVDFALKRKDLGLEIKKFLKEKK